MLTHQQEKLLQFINNFQLKSNVTPSFDEMKDGLGLKSKSGIHRILSALEERGYIRKLNNRARAIEVLKFPKNTFTSLFRTQKNKKRAQIMINTSGWFHTPSLKFAIEMVGIENICYSIDTPYEKLKEADDWLKSLPISKKNKEMIAWKNANNLLKLY